MGFRGSERPAQRESSVSHTQRSGGRGPAYRGARGGGDARGGMAAYQHSTRTRQGGRRLLNNEGRQISPGSGGGWGGGERREQKFDAGAENESFWEDKTMQRLGGDGSVRNRLIGMYDSNDPLSNSDFFNEWSGNEGEVFNPGAVAQITGGDFNRNPGAREQAEALEQFNMMRGFI